MDIAAVSHPLRNARLPPYPRFSPPLSRTFSGPVGIHTLKPDRALDGLCGVKQFVRVDRRLPRLVLLAASIAIAHLAEVLDLGRPSRLDGLAPREYLVGRRVDGTGWGILKHTQVSLRDTHQLGGERQRRIADAARCDAIVKTCAGTAGPTRRLDLKPTAPRDGVLQAVDAVL